MGQNPVSTSTRRNLLTRATFLVGGAWLGWVVRGSETKAAVVAPSAPPAGTRLELHGRHIHLHSQLRKRGERPVRGDQVIVYGELMSSAEGAKVGEFYSSWVFTHSPFGAGPSSAMDIQSHTFVLDDGVIFGTGVTRQVRTGPLAYAVVGGTGRYANARGTYTAELSPEELGGSGGAHFIFSLV